MSNIQVKSDGMNDLLNALEKADGKDLSVGWFSSAKYKDGTPVAGVAAVQEYGSAKMGIQPRSFMRPTISEKQKQWDNIIKAGTQAVLKGNKTITQVLEALGTKVEADIKNTIVNSNYPKLSPITIALRRFRDDGGKVSGKIVGEVAAAIAAGQTGKGQLGDQSYPNQIPLQDSGYMIATLTHQVR